MAVKDPKAYRGSVKSVFGDKSPHLGRLPVEEKRKTPASLHFLPNCSGTNLALRRLGGNHSPITEEAFRR